MKTCGEVFRIFRIWVKLGWIGRQLLNDSHGLKKISLKTLLPSRFWHIFFYVPLKISKIIWEWDRKIRTAWLWNVLLLLVAIFILHKGLFGLFQTTHPPLYGIVSILTHHPQILRKIFENHLPPRKKMQKKKVSLFSFLETIVHQLLLKNDVWCNLKTLIQNIADAWHLLYRTYYITQPFFLT